MPNQPEKSDVVAAFSARLNHLLDERKYHHEGPGRQTELGKKYGMTQNAARKWLEGEGMPAVARMIQIARDFGCNFEWLATGRGAMEYNEAPPHMVAEPARPYRVDPEPPSLQQMVDGLAKALNRQSGARRSTVAGALQRLTVTPDDRELIAEIVALLESGQVTSGLESGAPKLRKIGT
jgi:transcriptional regulator with XRE-family HTH domain